MVSFISTVVVLSIFVFKIWSQFVCSEDGVHEQSTLKLPSWCEHYNYEASFPRSFFGDGNCGDDYNCKRQQTIPDYVCDDENDKDSYCSYVSVLERSEDLRFLLFATKTKLFVANFLNIENYQEKWRIPAAGMVKNDTIIEISVLETAGKSEAVPVTVLTNSSVYFFHLNITLMQFTLCHTHNFNDNEKTTYAFYELNTFFDSNGEKYVYFVLKNKDDATKYKIKFFEANSCGGIQEKIVWEITVNSGTILLGVDYFYHHVNQDSSSPYLFVSEKNFERKNVVFVLYDQEEVHMLPFITNSSSLFQINLPLSESTRFYTVSVGTNKISSASFIADKIQRLDYSSSNCGFFNGTLSQPVHLIVAENYEFGSWLYVIELKEFFDRSYSMPLNFTNYASRKGFCSNNKYYNEEYSSCEVRNQEMFMLDKEFVSKVKGKFLSLPVDEDSMEIELNTICNLAIDFGSFESMKEFFLECGLYNDTAYQCGLQKLLSNEKIRDLVYHRFFHYTIAVSTLSVIPNFIRFFQFGYSLDGNDFYNGEYETYLFLETKVQALGRLNSWIFSENSFYFFFSTRRQKWELDSAKRFTDFCHAEIEGDLDTFLSQDIETRKHVRNLCSKVKPKYPSINDFIYYLSFCFSNLYCGSFSKSSMSTLDDGHYSPTPFVSKTCEKGSSCWWGYHLKSPPGTYTNVSESVFPKICKSDLSRLLTCYEPGSTSETNFCPGGTICVTRTNVLAVPQGNRQKIDVYENLEYGVTFPYNTMKECNISEWCPCMVPPVEDNSTHQLLCPQGHWCKNTSILVPEECEYKFDENRIEDLSYHGYSDFCPPGTYKEEHRCPIGPLKNVTCQTPFYCGGGFFKPIICPGGSYCRNPSTKKKCPALYYCPDGSLKPKRCGLFNPFCTAGSRVNQFNYLQLILIFFLFGIIYAFYVVFRIARSLFDLRSKVRDRVFYETHADVEEVEKNEGFVLDLAFKNLTLKLKGSKKIVVNNITGKIKGGQVTAILGSSGSGKTSFITALADRAHYGNVSGEVYVNGVELKLSQLKKLVAFVPQEDVMERKASVKETLAFSCATRLPGTTKRRKIRKIVEDSLKTLGLANVKNSLIGDEHVRGISGGQRKRVNIGMEIVSKPTILFLDEPTSGLDSSCSLEVVENLKKVAKRGMNVMAVLHQPRYEIYEQLDTIMLLASGGRVVYLGPVRPKSQHETKSLSEPEETKVQSESKEDLLEDEDFDVETYFKDLGFVVPDKVNPPDYFLDAIAGNVTDKDGKRWSQEEFVETWENKKLQDVDREIIKDEEKAKNVVNLIKKERKKRKFSVFIQFKESLLRSIIVRLRDLKGFYLSLFLIIIGGSIMGALFAGFTNSIGDILKQSIMISLLLGLCGFMGSLNTFAYEKNALFIREKYSGLNSLCHYLSLNIIDLAGIFFGPLAFFCIMFYLATPQGSFWMYYWVGVSEYFTTYALGYILCIVFKQESKVAGIIFIISMQTFSGLVERVSVMKEWTVPMNYLPYTSYFTYCTEMFFTIEMIAFDDYYDINFILKEVGYNRGHFKFLVWVIFGFGFVFRFVAYVCLLTIPPDSTFKKMKGWVIKLFSKLGSLLLYPVYTLMVVCFLKKGERSVFSSVYKDTYTVANEVLGMQKKSHVDHKIQERAEKNRYMEWDTFKFIGTEFHYYRGKGKDIVNDYAGKAKNVVKTVNTVKNRGLGLGKTIKGKFFKTVSPSVGIPPRRRRDGDVDEEMDEFEGEENDEKVEIEIADKKEDVTVEGEKEEEEKLGEAVPEEKEEEKEEEKVEGEKEKVEILEEEIVLPEKKVVLHEEELVGSKEMKLNVSEDIEGVELDTHVETSHKDVDFELKGGDVLE